MTTLGPWQVLQRPALKDVTSQLKEMMGDEQVQEAVGLFVCRDCSPTVFLCWHVSTPEKEILDRVLIINNKTIGPH